MDEEPRRKRTPASNAFELASSISRALSFPPRRCVHVEPTEADISQGKDVVLLEGLRIALRRAGVVDFKASMFVAIEQSAETARGKI